MKTELEYEAERKAAMDIELGQASLRERLAETKLQDTMAELSRLKAELEQARSTAAPPPVPAAAAPAPAGPAFTFGASSPAPPAPAPAAGPAFTFGASRFTNQLVRVRLTKCAFNRSLNGRHGIIALAQPQHLIDRGRIAVKVDGLGTLPFALENVRAEPGSEAELERLKAYIRQARSTAEAQNSQARWVSSPFLPWAPSPPDTTRPIPEEMNRRVLRECVLPCRQRGGFDR